MSIERAQENLVTEDGETAIDTPATGPNIGRQLSLVKPEGTAGAGIESEGAIIGGSAVEDTVDD